VARRIRTERGLDRLVNFSDATVAIAITLLLLPLVDVAPEVASHGLGEVLRDNAFTLIAFAMSFAVIARLWLAHHRVFESVASYDETVLRLNFLWLASIVFLPFASNVIAHTSHSTRATNALYAGTILLASVALLLIEMRVVRRPELLVEDGRAQLHLIDTGMTAAALALVVVLGLAVPQGGQYWLLLLLAAAPVARAVRRRRPDRSAAVGS
jgi:uncharacterized membrane protein